jgi:glutamate synthase domain-containing protein 1
MEKKEQGVDRDEAQINGRTEGPQGTDGTDVDQTIQDNKRTDLVDDSANGLDSVQVRGGQDGRNNRGIGGMDMDSKNGVLRKGDLDDSTMEVTEEGAKNAAASVDQTRTSTVDVTTAGPDDYASAETVGVPNAQKEAKEAAESTDANDSDTNAAASQEEEDEEIARTGTSIEHQPAY